MNKNHLNLILLCFTKNFIFLIQLTEHIWRVRERASEQYTNTREESKYYCVIRVAASMGFLTTNIHSCII